MFITGCGNKTVTNKNSYSSKETIGDMHYIISKKPSEIKNNGEQVDGESRYHAIRYDYGDYYIVVKMQTEKIDKAFDYVDKEVNGIKYRYCADIGSGSGLEYSAIINYNNLYYSIEYFQFHGRVTETSKQVYHDILESISFKD